MGYVSSPLIYFHQYPSYFLVSLKLDYSMRQADLKGKPVLSSIWWLREESEKMHLLFAVWVCRNAAFYKDNWRLGMVAHVTTVSVKFFH